MIFRDIVPRLIVSSFLFDYVLWIGQPMCVVAILPKQTIPFVSGDLSFPNPSSKNLTLGKRTCSVDTRIGEL